MPYERVTKDSYEVQVKTPRGWKYLTAEDTPEAAHKRLLEYWRKDAFARYRVEKIRVDI